MGRGSDESREGIVVLSQGRRSARMAVWSLPSFGCEVDAEEWLERD